MTSGLIAALVGLVIPIAVAAITREKLPTRFKAYILLFFSTATGILSGLTTNPPTGWSQWEHVIGNIIIAFIAAAGADYGGWHPTGVRDRVTARTASFGIGPREPNKESGNASTTGAAGP